MAEMVSVMLIGLGPHARHHYFPILRVLEHHGIARLACVVDLASQASSVSHFLEESGGAQVDVIFLDDRCRDDLRVSRSVSQQLCKAVNIHHIQKVIIATEPKAHEAYALWAASLSLDYLVDKPLVTAGYGDVAKHGCSDLYERYRHILEESQKSGICAALMALRRTHPAIEFVRGYLDEFIAEHQVPITNISIHHGEGMWNMPDEYNTRENHPYKYGYGGLFHTGYHFVDLMVWLLEANRNIEGWDYDSVELAVSFTRPQDINGMIGPHAYRNLLDYDLTKSGFRDDYQYGEVDWQAIVNYINNRRVVASGNLNVLQTNYSARCSAALPEDVYKGNGRTYHEVISIEVGYLLSIRILRMTVGTQREKSIQKNPYESFRVLIYRNANLVGGMPFEEHVFPYNGSVWINGEEVCMNMGDIARYRTICDWLNDHARISALSCHDRSQKLFSKLHELLATAHNDGRTMAYKAFNL